VSYFLLLQPGYYDEAILYDTDFPAHLEELRKKWHVGDRFVFDSQPGDFFSVSRDQWVLRLGRDFAAEDEQG
jgi:hypothetical protein